VHRINTAAGAINQRRKSSLLRPLSGIFGRQLAYHISFSGISAGFRDVADFSEPRSRPNSPFSAGSGRSDAFWSRYQMGIDGILRAETSSRETASRTIPSSPRHPPARNRIAVQQVRLFERGETTMQQNDIGAPGRDEVSKSSGQAQQADDKEALSNPELFEAYEESMGELSDADNAASAGGPAV
jgi:hypothetical protein